MLTVRDYCCRRYQRGRLLADGQNPLDLAQINDDSHAYHIYQDVTYKARRAVMYWLLARPIANKDVVRLIAEMVWRSRGDDAGAWIESVR